MKQVRGKVRNAPRWALTAGVGCLSLFLLPFIGIGVFSIVKAIRMILEGSHEAREILPELMFGAVFTTAGFGFLLVFSFAGRMAMKESTLKARHPDEPWMWREEWTRNRIAGQGKRTLFFSWCLAFLWNLITWVTVATQYRGILERTDPSAILFALFPLFGVGLIAWAVRETIRWRKYGVSTLSLETLPALVGERLVGTIQTGLRGLPEGGVTLTLNCVRRTRSSGNKTREEILWQKEQRVGREQLSRTPGGYGIPVVFSIPEGCEGTVQSFSGGVILWRLLARAEVPGVDFAGSFVVPVFQTGGREETAAENIGGDATADGMAYEAPPQAGTVRIRPGSAGGTEFYFGPFRNPRMVLIMAFFVAAFAVPILFSFGRGRFSLLALIFAPFVLLMAFVVVRMVAGTSRVVASPDSLRIYRGIFGIPFRRIVVPRQDVEDVRLSIGMEEGPKKGSVGRAYYCIDIIRRDGSKVVAGWNVKDKKEASFIAQEIRRSIGIWPAHF